MKKDDIQPLTDVEEVYCVSDVARILRMSERTAYDFCSKTKEFIVKRCGPRLLRINKASFDSWLNS